MEEDGNSGVSEVVPATPATDVQTTGNAYEGATTDSEVVVAVDTAVTSDSGLIATSNTTITSETEAVAAAETAVTSDSGLTVTSDSAVTSDSGVMDSDKNESADKDSNVSNKDDSVANESGVVMETTAIEVSPAVNKDTCDRACDPCETNEDARSVEDLDSLPAVDELVLGAAGSDSGVEGCGGRALSSGGGSRSCASSVVSCGSGCGSESSSLAGAPPRPRRRVVNVNDPKRSSPVGSSTPHRPATAPRGPNLATRERARSREKPTPPEKPRPLTPKPRIRPTGELPNVVRESPALRAKPTKTSTARCRTPSSPCEEKRWPSNGPRLPTVADATATRVAADKYGTLPRKRRDGAESEGSPKHESTPPSSRRPTVTRSSSSRSAVRTRVRIYAEKTSQTVLLGTDVESALGGVLPNIETRCPVSVCHRGVQASARESDAARIASAAAAAAQERARRVHAEAALADERDARRAALADLHRNSQRLLELAGAAGAGAGAEGCLRALEEQLCAASEQATRHRAEIDQLRDQCNKLHAEACSERSRARAAEARLAEAEREAAEMQDFLAAETSALTHSLRDAEADVARLHLDLDKRRAECRQLVRMCEQRRQEALALAARARGEAGAARALDSLARRLGALTRAVCRAYRLPRDQLEPTLYHNEAFSRSDSGEALSPEEEPRGGLLGAVARALRNAPPPLAAPPADDDRSHGSEDNSADLLDSETEPCLVTDPEYAEEWWSGAEGAGAWSGDELSPERDSCHDPDPDPESASVSERESLSKLSAAITHRQRSEAEDGRGSLVARVAVLDQRLSSLLAALRLASGTAAAHGDGAALRLAHALRDKIDVTEKNVADVVVKKLAELDASKHMMDQYRHSVEQMHKKQMALGDEEDDLEYLEEEVSVWSESERRARYEALDGAVCALAGAGRGWPRLRPVLARLERLAFALAAPPPPPVASPAAAATLQSTA